MNAMDYVYDKKRTTPKTAKGVYTPYGYFNSITDAAKYIYTADSRLRKHWEGLHPYNTITNLRNMVVTRCRDEDNTNWRFTNE
jgi:hypothetical protein